MSALSVEPVFHCGNGGDVLPWGWPAANGVISSATITKVLVFPYWR
jgi:hypothetical protein